MSQAPVLDFTSACYLGLRHPCRALRPWRRLTAGVPAALAEPRSARAVSRSLARLAGTECAVLATSTLHAFWDLFVALGTDRIACYLDAGAYPIAGWGVERAVARGAPVRRFPHQNAAALGRLLGSRPAGRVPVVVTDGVCPGCGSVAPVRCYLRVLGPLGGLLVVDDTQGLGVLGAGADPRLPYGRGGGGILRVAGLSSPQVLVVSSLAKAFGVPVAVVAGARPFVERYTARSETRVHCSPPSMAHLSAARHALEVNRGQGDQRRARLLTLIRRLQAGARQIGLMTGPGTFPVQAIGPVPGVPPTLLYQRLAEAGIRAVLHRPACEPVPRCSLLVNASHTPGEIDRAIIALDAATSDRSTR
jgi:8-amino-7-oxononanoate synthase